ncbi:hypothetical protein [Saccharothrix sp.]|uniref:hypothetical protein n=1 Tax=Saccharothrix sp. TaxID=1873460 RepID=UPI002811F32C|nr:hypothetical protein [Saccharothrix sp.]
MSEPSDLLAPLRAVEPDERTTVDIGRAIRTGKRRKRIRNGLTALAAVVLTVVALSPFLVRPSPPPEPAGPAEFDVLRQVVRVGSAAGYHGMSYQTGRYQHTILLARAADPVAQELGAITVHARGRYPGQGGPGWAPHGQPAPDVHGRRAVWLDAGGLLAWEWGDGAWASVRLEPSFPDMRDRAHRVAQSVVPTADTPVRVPLTVDGSTLRQVSLVGVRIPLRGTGDLGGLVFASNDEPTAPNAVVVLEEDLAVHVESVDAPLMGVAGEVIDSVEAVSDPANRDNWVANPVR